MIYMIIAFHNTVKFQKHYLLVKGIIENISCVTFVTYLLTVCDVSLGTIHGLSPLIYGLHHEKTRFLPGKNKGADHCEADQRLSFRYMDSTIPLFIKSKISSL